MSFKESLLFSRLQAKNLTLPRRSTGRSWSTVSVDRNVISASLNALVDGFEFALLREETFCRIDDYDYGDWD